MTKFFNDDLLLYKFNIAKLKYDFGKKHYDIINLELAKAKEDFLKYLSNKNNLVTNLKNKNKFDNFIKNSPLVFKIIVKSQNKLDRKASFKLKVKLKKNRRNNYNE